MAILGFEVEDIARMLALMESSDLEEIEWEESTRYIKVSGPCRPRHETEPTERNQAQALPTPRTRTPPRVPQKGQKAIAAKAPAELREDQVALVSPRVGVFYRSGKPGDSPLVEVGQIIAQDQTIGIIEAMKIFSEIPAEHGGTVIAIPAQDGQLVHAGTPLMILQK